MKRRSFLKSALALLAIPSALKALPKNPIPPSIVKPVALTVMDEPNAFSVDDWTMGWSIEHPTDYLQYHHGFDVAMIAHPPIIKQRLPVYGVELFSGIKPENPPIGFGIEHKYEWARIPDRIENGVLIRSWQAFPPISYNPLT